MLQPKDIDWLNGYKNKTCIYAVDKRPTSDLGTHTDWKCPLKWKSKENQGSNIYIRIDFKTKIATRNKEGHYIIIKGSIQEEDITIINTYAPNIGAPQYIRQMLTDIKGEIDSNSIIVEDFNTPLTPMDRSSKQKVK